MRAKSPVPGAIDKPLQTFLSNRLVPSTSRVPALYRETTICFSYMCSYAYACSEKAERPAQVMMRRCMRYMPESMRIPPAMSDFALDLLAKHRQAGEVLSPDTTAVLDEFRPQGPIRKQS